MCECVCIQTLRRNKISLLHLPFDSNNITKRAHARPRRVLPPLRRCLIGPSVGRLPIGRRTLNSNPIGRRPPHTQLYSNPLQESHFHFSSLPNVHRLWLCALVLNKSLWSILHPRSKRRHWQVLFKQKVCLFCKYLYYERAEEEDTSWSVSRVTRYIRRFRFTPPTLLTKRWSSFSRVVLPTPTIDHRPPEAPEPWLQLHWNQPSPSDPSCLTTKTTTSSKKTAMTSWPTITTSKMTSPMTISWMSTETISITPTTNRRWTIRRRSRRRSWLRRKRPNLKKRRRTRNLRLVTTP